MIEDIDIEDDNYKEFSTTDNKSSIAYRTIRYSSFDENIQLTKVLTDSRTSSIIGLIDPRTNNRCMKTDKDVYVRTDIMNHLYNNHRRNYSFGKIKHLVKLPF